MQELTNTPETANPEIPEPTTSDIEQVAALLEGETPRTDEHATGDGGKSGETEGQTAETLAKGESPKTLSQLAEALGVEAADLYALEIPIDREGESVTHTLGELKDAMTDRSGLELERLEWEETKAAKESEFAKSAQELTELISMLPKNAISKELLAAVAQRRATLAEREATLTRNVIPEWKDETTEAKDRETMRDHLAQYGFPANYLESVLDHRTLRFVRDAALREQRIRRVLEQVRTVKKPAHSSSNTPSAKTKAKSAGGSRKSRSDANAVRQIENLLRTG